MAKKKSKAAQKRTIKEQIADTRRSMYRAQTEKERRILELQLKSLMIKNEQN